MPQVSDESACENEAVPDCEPSVVVAVSPPLRLEPVPQAKPDCVAFAPPVAEIEAFSVAAAAETEEAAEVVRVGTTAAPTYS